jgi:gluconolactonase
MRELVSGLEPPEGPAFDATGALWCVELEGGSLVRWTEAGDIARYPTGGVPNGLAFDRAGRAVFCDAGRNAVRWFDPARGEWGTLADAINGQPLFAPNDLAYDAVGNLVFTCPGDSRAAPTGYVCCLRRDGALVRIADRMYYPNGLVFTDGGATLVIAETWRPGLWIGGWDAEAARWIDPRPWADVGGPKGPDGMALGVDGLVYVGVSGTGFVKGVDRAGRVVYILSARGSRPTNVAFDPNRTLGLVVTEAERGVLLSFPDLGPGVPLFSG